MSLTKHAHWTTTTATTTVTTLFMVLPWQSFNVCDANLLHDTQLAGHRIRHGLREVNCRPLNLSGSKRKQLRRCENYQEPWRRQHLEGFLFLFDLFYSYMLGFIRVPTQSTTDSMNWRSDVVVVAVVVNTVVVAVVVVCPPLLSAVKWWSRRRREVALNAFCGFKRTLSKKDVTEIEQQQKQIQHISWGL